MSEHVNMIHSFDGTVTHTQGGRPVAVSMIHPCGGVALVYDHRPKLGEKSDAACIVNPRPAKNGEPVACMSCDMPVGPNSVEPEGGWADAD